MTDICVGGFVMEDEFIKTLTDKERQIKDLEEQIEKLKNRIRRHENEFNENEQIYKERIKNLVKENSVCQWHCTQKWWIFGVLGIRTTIKKCKKTT